MSACWPLQGMSPTCKAVLISLADQANDQWVCWPGIASIAARTCLSERAVRQALRWLEENNAIETEEQRGTSSRYTITPQHFGGPRQELLPGMTCPPARRAAPSGTSCPPPRHDVPPTPARGAPKPSDNHQGTISKPKKTRERVLLSADDLVTRYGVDRQVADDFVASRNAKKAALTLTAMEGLIAEYQRAELTVEGGMRVQMQRGWQGFNADWLKDKKPAKPSTARHIGYDKNNYEEGTRPDGSF